MVLLLVPMCSNEIVNEDVKLFLNYYTISWWSKMSGMADMKIKSI